MSGEERQLKKIRITLLPAAQRFILNADKTLTEQEDSAAMGIESPCDGAGFCGRCRVRFLENVPPPTSWDRLHFESKELSAGFRLACKAKLDSDSIVVVPNKPGKVRIQGKEYKYNFAPSAQKTVIHASLSDITDDNRHILPITILTAYRKELTLYSVGSDLTKTEPGASKKQCQGVAAAVRNRRISVWAHDLESGEEIFTDTVKEISKGQSLQGLLRAACLKHGRRLSDINDALIVTDGTLRIDEEEGNYKIFGREKPSICGLAIASMMGADIQTDAPHMLMSLEPYPWILLTVGNRCLLTWDYNGFFRKDLFNFEHDISDELKPTFAQAIEATIALKRIDLIDDKGLLHPTSPSRKIPEIEILDIVHNDKNLSIRIRTQTDTFLLSQAHIRQVQRIKGVLADLQDKLLTKADIDSNELVKIVLAGNSLGFASQKGLKDLGILRASEGTVIESFPDAEAFGARLMLLSSRAYKDANRLLETIEATPNPMLSRDWASNLYISTQSKNSHKLKSKEKVL